MFADAGVPCAKLAFIQRVVEAEHRRAVRDFDEPFARRPADALRGRIGCEKLRVLSLEFLQLAHELVVFGVGDLRRVRDVVKIFVPAKRFAQVPVSVSLRCQTFFRKMQ